MTESVSLADFECPEDRLVTATSYFIDRAVADCEIICLPAKTVRGGDIKLELSSRVSYPVASPKRMIFNSVFNNKPSKSEKLIFECRHNNPFNWAHFLNDHLPLLFFSCEHLDIDVETTKIVLPKKTPHYISQAAHFFGLDVLFTDKPVQGIQINVKLLPWFGNRSVRYQWANLPYPRRMLAAANNGSSPNKKFSDRIFISRRRTRMLENEVEIETMLAARGFQKVYTEDLQTNDQFRLFEDTKEIVAIHGAALAPLLYKSKRSKLERIVELLPCSHMTDNFRVMSHQVGCSWTGVRGRIKREHVRGAYNLASPFLKYSLQSFFIDPVSLEVALDMQRNQVSK